VTCGASVDTVGEFVVCFIPVGRSVEGHAVETHDNRAVGGSLVKIHVGVLVGGEFLGTPVLSIPVGLIESSAGQQKSQ